MRKIALVLGAVALVGGVTAGGATAAPGTYGWEQCESGDWCMWDLTNAGGDVYFDTNPPPKENPDLVPFDGWNDRADSVANMTTRSICVFWDVDYGGNYIRIPPAPNGRVNLPASWRNKVSSYRQLPSGITSCVYD